MPKLYLLVGLILVLAKTHAQTGKEFWFVAPDVISDHGESPVAFHITALDAATTVVLSQPANPSFSETITLNAHQHKKIEFNSWDGLDQIENSPANQVNNKGILITSDEDVTVYYEIAHSNNPDKFTLKGENALGKEFFVSSQTSFYNYGIKDDYRKYDNNPPVEQVNIVATQDGTTVDILPTSDIEGHSEGVLFTITLDCGQSYCLKGNKRVGSYSLMGTYIKSDKDIAVTISDDSVCEYGWEHDLIGDQTIPTSVIGTEYVAMFSGIKKQKDKVAPINKVYVLATKDDTHFSVDVNQTTQGSFTLNKGEQREFDIEEEEALYISSDKPVYVYQLSGLVFGSKHNELGSAILPPMKCTGSSTVTFTRNLDKSFYVQVLTQYENINFFNFYNQNGVTNSAMDDLDWKRVPGTGDANMSETWYFANKDLNGLIKTGDPYRLTNSNGLFHLSIFDQNSTSASFGYYSAFNSLVINGPTEQCVGTEIRLTASDGLDSYNWYSKSTGDKVLSTDFYYDVTESGLYWVEAQRMINSTEGCEMVDSLEIEFNMPEFSLGSDVTVCNDESYEVTPDIDLGTHEWYDGSTGETYTYTATSGGTEEVWLEIVDEDGCIARDTIEVTTLPPVNININLDVTVNNSVCYGHIIKNTTELDAYEWRFGSSTSSIISEESEIEVFNSGWYYLTATEDGCTATDSVQVTVLPLPTILLNDDLLCQGVLYTTPVNNTDYAYEWRTVNSSISSNALQISFSQTDSVYVLVTDPLSGCQNKDSAYIFYRDEITMPDINVSVCAYTNQQLVADASISGPYTWFYNSNPLKETSNTLALTNIQSAQSGKYEVIGQDAKGCTVRQNFNLNISLGDPIDLGTDKSICKDDEITLGIGTQPANNFQWFFNENPEVNSLALVVATTPSYTIGTEGKYYVKTQHSNGCYSVDSVNVIVNDLPTVSLVNPGPECQGESETFNAGEGFASYLWQDGSTNQNYIASYPQDVSVTVVDENGCENSDALTYEWQPVNVFANDEVVVCPSADFTLNASSSLSNISWYFDNGSGIVNLGNNTNTYTISGVSLSDVGDYIVRAIDKGCAVEDTISLFIVDVASINLGPDRSVCEGEVVELNANLGFDSYKWRLASDMSTVVSTSQTIIAGQETSANPEVWVLEVEESDSGCSLTDQISVEKVPVPTFDLQDNIDACPGVVLVEDIISTLNSNSNINSADQVKYYWGDDLINDEILSDLVIEDSGTFEVYVSNQYQDTNGDVFECYASDDINVSFHTEFVIPQLSDHFICIGETTTLQTPATVTSYTELQNYQWLRLNADNSIAETNTQNTDWINASAQGRYVLNVNYTGDACLASDTLVLQEKSSPSVNILGDFDICRGESSILSATAGFAGYNWSTGGITDTIIVNSSGTYEVTVTGQNGCITTESAIVKVQELPIVTISNSTVIKCEGESSQLDITSLIYPDGTAVISPTYLWNTWETTSSISVKAAGNYDVEVTDFNGCAGVANSVVSNYNKVSIDLSAIEPTACLSNGVDLVCPLALGSDISSFQWSKSGGDLSANPAVNTNWNVTVSGTYILTVVDNNLCESIDSIDVTIITGPTVELGADADKCVGDSIYLNLPQQYDSYLWSTGSTASAVVVETSSTPVSYEVTVWDSNGCSASDTVLIKSLPLPTVTLNDPPKVCAGEKVELSPSVLSPSGSYSVWWSCNTSNKTVEVGQGTYSVVAIDDVSGCMGTDTVTVETYPATKVTLGDDIFLCPTINEYPIYPQEGDIFGNYLWHNNAISYQIDGDIGSLNNIKVTDLNGCSAFDQIVLQYMITEDTVYQFAMCQQDTTISLLEIDSLAEKHTGEYLWFHDGSRNEYNTFSTSDTFAVDIGITLDGANTCYYKRDSLIFDFYPLPEIKTLDTLIYSQITVGVDMVNAPYQYSLDSIYWQDENVFTGLNTGTYNVYVIDVNECTSSKSVSISADYDIVVPNFFTPNNDGYNDSFNINGIERMPDSVIRIYDRFGKLLIIYPATAPGWDGKYLGKPMPTNDYWYVVELLPVKKLLKGHFTLKR